MRVVPVVHSSHEVVLVAIGSVPLAQDEGRPAYEMKLEALWEWHRKWRAHVGPDLLGGYATLHYPTRKDTQDDDGMASEPAEC